MRILTYLVGLSLMYAAHEQNNAAMLWAGALASIVSGASIVLFTL